jgi:DNA-binding IclR family transcriptional regulator
MLASVNRAGRLLDLLTAEKPSWGVTEIALAMGVPKSSAHSLARSLEEIGMLRQGPDRRYRLGWRIVRLHRSLIDTSELYDAARPVLRGVRQRAGCAIAVVVEAGGRADVLLAEGPVGAPSAAAESLATGRLVPAGTWTGAAAIRSWSGAVVGAVDVSAAGGPGVRVGLTSEHLRRIASSAAAEISGALRASNPTRRPRDDRQGVAEPAFGARERRLVAGRAAP